MKSDYESHTYNSSFYSGEVTEYRYRQVSGEDTDGDRKLVKCHCEDFWYLVTGQKKGEMRSCTWWTKSPHYTDSEEAAWKWFETGDSSHIKDPDDE